MPRPPLVLAVALFASACGPGGGSAPSASASTPAAAPGPAPASARLVDPVPARHAARITTTGTLRARSSAPLAFPVPGTLARIAVERGQEVRKGAPLAALDDAAAAAAEKQAAAAVAAARAQLALAEDALARVTRLRTEDGASEAQAFQSRAQRDQAAAQLAAAEAQLDQARVHLRHHLLLAPFAGVVTRIPDGLGLTVAPGVPMLTLVATRELVLESSLTQEDAAELSRGAAVTVTVAATGARTTDARLAVVVPAVEAGTGRVPIEITVPNERGTFLAGAFARAELPRGAARDAWRVPATSLVQRGGAHAVWVAGADGRARALPVRLLAEEGDVAVVSPAEGGWPAGLEVIASPPIGLAEGTPVAEVRG